MSSSEHMAKTGGEEGRKEERKPDEEQASHIHKRVPFRVRR